MSPETEDVRDSTIEPSGITYVDSRDASFHCSHCAEENEDIFSEDSDEDNEDKDFEDLQFHSDNHASENKYLVFDCWLMMLISKVPCQQTPRCQGKLTKVKRKLVGSLLTIFVQCENGHQFKLWDSQPKHGLRPLGNVLISSAIIVSGSSFLRIKHFFSTLKMCSIGKSTHYKNQKNYIFPAIDHHWNLEQRNVLEDMRKASVCLTGDGPSDSPGFCAKYCIYSMMDTESKKICSFSIEQVVPPTTSVSLEKIAFEKNVIATDRHAAIRKVMREKYPNIQHQFNVWHLAKSVGKKILAASKKKEANKKNHLWWSSRTCRRDSDQLILRWKSMLQHVINIHEWSGSEPYIACEDLPLTAAKLDNTKWLEPTSTALTLLKGIVENKNLLRDIRQINFFCHTGELELYHSGLKYRPKRLHFFIDAMIARSQLAALDHNRNVDRLKAVVQHDNDTDPTGSGRYRLEFSKARKAWVVKCLYEPTSQDFQQEIVSDVIRIMKKELQTTWSSKCTEFPPNIASVPKPDKQKLFEESMQHTNGQTERTNQTLETYLRCFVSADQDDWVSFLPLAEFALNNRASSATLVSPFFCNSGFHPRFSSGQVESSDCPGVDTVVDRLQQIWTHVVDNLTLSQEKAQRFANRRRCVGPRLQVGDLVWLSSRHIPMKVSSPKFKTSFYWSV
ncbi:unnamed protein product [Ranitomeya imitator]|uniref:Transposase n=1 Tax=Ranitomeya imitator TaxID=111125 RepID=A0ABN9LKL4_9NEOB|nr:unnamed protein product [Ranitomeya imitator]